MLRYLGSRGRTATYVVGVGAIAAVVLAAQDHHWSEAVGLALLGYLCVMAAATWGLVRATLRTSTQAGRRQQKIGKAEAAQLRAIHTRLGRANSVIRSLASSTKAPSPASGGTHSVERRFASKLDQPPAVPHSSLLSFLEILAKDATTRRADEAAITHSVRDLREIVEAQQKEIVSLHRQLAGVDTLPSARSGF